MRTCCVVILVVLLLSDNLLALSSLPVLKYSEYDEVAYSTNFSQGLLPANNRSPGLLRRQSEQKICTLYASWIDCGNERCCPQGYQCCSDGCCPENTRCYPNGKCCPNSAETCNRGYCLREGESCCGDSACGVGAECMKSPGGRDVCCRPGMSACDDGKCCDAGTVCVAGGRCREIVLTSVTRTSISTSTSTSMSTRTSTRTLMSTKTFTKTSTSKLSSATCKPKGTSNKARDVYDNGDYVSINGECLPVMDFVSVDGLTEQLTESMCGGIQHKQWPGRIADNMIILTKRGYRKQTPNCPGDCPGTIDPKYNEATQCDEFPFGSTMEGGDADAHTMCIVWWQNSIQSSLIRQYNRFYNLQTDDRFVVRILPGCDAVGSSSRSSKRSDVSGLEQSGQIRSQKDGNSTLISSSYNIWRQDPIPGAPNGTGNIFVPLGAVAPGVFDTKLHITGTLNQLQVLSDEGTEYSEISPTAASASLNFTVPNSDNLFMVAPALQNASVNISYTCTVKPLPANSSTANAAGSHIQDSRRTYWRSPLLLVVVEILVILHL